LALALALGLGACASGGGGTGGAPARGTRPSGGGNLLTQGERPRENADTRAAERALAAAEDATSPDAAQAQYRLALQSAEAAIAADPTNPLAHRLAGFAALGLEDYRSAAAHLDRAEQLRPIYQLELSPIREQAFIDRYSASAPFLESGDYGRAAEILEGAHAIYPRRPEALLLLAQIYAQLRQHDRALERIDQIMAFLQSDAMNEVDSATAAGWREQAAELPLMRGRVLVDAGRLEDALPIYEQVARSNPDDILTTQDLAVIYMQLGRTDDALRVYDGLMIRPDLDTQSLYRIGVGYYNASRYDRAAEAFGRSAQRSRMHRDALEMWARSLQLDSAFAAVPPVAERWIALDPASQVGIVVLAQAVNAMGDGQRASEIIRRVDQLPITVDELQMRTTQNGVTVEGSVTNRTLAPGASVVLNFTFYSESGAQLGVASHRVTVGTPAQAQPFQVSFDTTETVGGYGYQYTTG
jgi:tetratricopeptide (TPR) repeat protein